MTVTGRRSSAVVWHTLSATDVAARLGVDVDNGLAEYETDTRLTTYGPNAIATEPPPSLLGRRPRAAVEPDEHHAADRRGRQPCDRAGRDRLLRGAAGHVQRRDGLRGRSSRRAPVSTRWRSCRCPHARVRRAGRVEEVDVDRSRPGRRRAARGRRRGARPMAGSWPRRRSRCRRPRSPARARRSPKDATTLPGGRRRAGRPHEHRVPEHAGHERDRELRRHRHRPGDPDGPHRRHGQRRPSACGHRCSASSTA